MGRLGIKRRKKQRKVKVVGVEVPPELKLSLSISGIPEESMEVKEVTLKEKKKEEGKHELPAERIELEKRKEMEKKFKSLRKKLGKGKESLVGFELPRLMIKLATLRRVIPEDKLLTKPYSPKGAEYSTIFITKDNRYLLKDPFITQQELFMMEDSLTKLFFLTESEVVVEALEDIDVLDMILEELGLNPKLRYLVKREVFGYGILDPLLKDPNLQDIIVPAANVPVKVIHREYGELVTNIVFNEKELDMYVEKLVSKANKTVSLYSPLASVQLPEGHRLTVCYKSEVTTKGSAIVIRKFPEKPWSIAALMKVNAISPEMAAWLMMLIENKKGVLVVGPMGSGKTSLTNALCNFIGKNATIVTIEDTPELRLAHEYWIQHKTREALTISGVGSISMFDLVKHALRESADYIIVGEVRGEEGRIWAQALATGHGGITTFHAESHTAAIARLTSPPISIERQMLSALKGIVMVRRFYKKITENDTVTWKPIRRVDAIYDMRIEGDKESFIQLFKYDITTDTFLIVQPVDDAPTARELMEELGWSRNTFINEYRERVNILRRLKKHVMEYDDTPLLSYEESTKLLWLFRESPEKAYKYIDEVEAKLSKKEREEETQLKPPLPEKAVRVESLADEKEQARPRIRIIRE